MEITFHCEQYGLDIVRLCIIVSVYNNTISAEEDPSSLLPFSQIKNGSSSDKCLNNLNQFQIILLPINSDRILIRHPCNTFYGRRRCYLLAVGRIKSECLVDRPKAHTVGDFLTPSHLSQRCSSPREGAKRQLRKIDLI